MGTNPIICPKCGSSLSDDDADGLCLTCLGRYGLSAETVGSGQLRLGDYELLEEIARGGMGVVYRARQLSLNRIVAVKVVLHGPFSSADFVRRFRTEAEATATLRHPNIVSIYEVGECDGHQFLAMEFIDGPNLAELVREQPLPARRAAGYLLAIARAVHHAHQRGVLHRDLKPSNVLLDAFDQPRVMDFGLAKILSHDTELTVTGQVLGSPNHMPPEQAAGKFSQTTAQSDVYSLGSMLYQLVAGRPPFQGGTLSELLVQVQTAEPIPPRHLNPSVPADLQSICLKCLRKEPAWRYASAEVLAEDLNRFLRHLPVLARPVSVGEKAWLWARRKPVLASLSLALVVAVLAGLGGILWEWHRAEFHARGEKQQRLVAEANAAKTRLNLYAADVNLAAQAIEDGDYGLARHTLDGLRPLGDESDLRGFEWRYLWRRSRGDQQAILSGHEWIVTCAVFSPDGQCVLSSGMGGEVRVWDVARHNCLRVFNPDNMAIWSLEFTPDGKTLMVAGTSGVQFWNTETWQRVARFPGRLAALAGDGSTVAIAESGPFYFDEAGGVTLWDWRKGAKVCTVAQRGRALAWSRDGLTLAVAGETTGITLWEAATGRLVKTLATDHPVWSMAFSPDGKTLGCAGWCGRALLWDLETAAAPRVISANRLNLWTLRFSPDGKTILTTSSDQTVRLWDAETLAPKGVLHGHANEVWCAAYSADGKMLVTGGKDQKVLLWQPDACQQSAPIPLASVGVPLFSPTDGKLFSRKPEDGQTGVLWSLEPMSEVASFRGQGFRAAGFSRDGLEMAFLNATDTALDFWSPGAAAPSHSVVLRDQPAQAGGFLKWGMSPEAGCFFALDATGRVRIWDADTGICRRSILGPPPPVRNMALSSQAGWLAVSVERDNEVHLFNVASGHETHLIGHKDFVSGLAFSPDGAMLATGSVDGTIRLWDTATGTPRGMLPGHMQETSDVAFSPDGRTLASISQGESLKLWHLPTLREVYSEDMPEAGTWLRFTPDGQRLVVGLRNNQVRFLSAPKE